MSAASQLIVVAYDNWDHMDWGSGGWVLMGLGMVLFWGLIIFAGVWLVRTLSGPGHQVAAQHAPSPLEVLDRRLADGTVSVEEYEKRRRLLAGSSTGAL